MADPITDKLLDNIGPARGTDYFLMKERLTPEEDKILSDVREFGEREVLPIVNSYWERGEFPFELVPKIAALYEQNRVRHAGAFNDLEDQLCAMTSDGFVGDGSPDRADALVWAAN
jgi:hypothetical protein